MSARHSCEELASLIINSPKFSECSGSSSPNKHHYGTGGLIQHTTEVVNLCEQVSSELGFNTTFQQELFLAALYHDIGKIYDYHFDIDKWVTTTHKRRIHHISRSAQIWLENSNKFKDQFPRIKEVQDSILHAILAHHGSKEAGSPITPDTKLAWILHLCDGLSARCNDTEDLR